MTRSTDSHSVDDMDPKKAGFVGKDDIGGLEGGTQTVESVSEDDRELEALGYVPSFKREFSNLATVSRRNLLMV